MSEDRGNAIRSRAPIWANVLELAEAWTPLDAPHKAKAATHNNCQSGLDQWSGKRDNSLRQCHLQQRLHWT